MPLTAAEKLEYLTTPDRTRADDMLIYLPENGAGWIAEFWDAKRGVYIPVAGPCNTDTQAARIACSWLAATARTLAGGAS